MPISLPISPEPSTTNRPLLVTADPELLDDVLRLGAAAGVDVDVAHDAVGARSGWSSAALVLVGDDQSMAMGRASMRRRAGVVLVGRGVDGDIWKRAMGVGAEHVALLPEAEPWLIARMADAVDESAVRGLTISVVGGRGGAGASTLAAALAMTAMRGGRRVMLVDADPYGGGADLLFGGEHAAGLRWSDIAGANGRIGGEELRAALPHVGELAVLSYDRGDPLDLRADAMTSVLAAAARVCDLVVADLPRHFDAAADVVLEASDLVLLVVPAEVRAVAAAARIASSVIALADDVRVVVRAPAPGGLNAIDVATALRLPLAGHLKAEPNLGASLERGEAPAGQGRGPLATFCRELLASLPFPDTRPTEPGLERINATASVDAVDTVVSVDAVDTAVSVDAVDTVVSVDAVDTVVSVDAVDTAGWRPTVAS
jgi:secretion/DNA translocation related CpaE-like protein